MYRKKIDKKSVVVISVLTILIIIGSIFLTTNFSFIGKKSIHEDAKKYVNKHCLVFYPDSKQGLKHAKDICKDNNNNQIYDYSLVPYGDYYQVRYGNGVAYFADKQYDSISVNQISDNGKRIVADYLRYTLKKEKPDKYYDIDTLKNTKYESLDFSEVTYDIEQENLVCHIPDYDIDLYIPLKYVQKEIGMDFGYPNELYHKPVYIDPDHPVIAITFDDGPQLWYERSECSSERIVDTLYEYDANATFFSIGTCLQERDVWSDYEVYSFLKKSINHGNEYGSHTQDHLTYLSDFSTSEEIKKAINTPANFMKEFLDYDIKLYRPVAGIFNEDVLNAQPFPAILWDIDSEDWSLMDADAIYNKIMDLQASGMIDDGDVLIFHDIYDSTAEAIERIIPELIKKGYQLVTVSDMLNYFQIDTSLLKYYYSITDYR